MDAMTEKLKSGAKVYYMRHILHNNDDEMCLRILQSQVSAMSNQSYLVVDEVAMPDIRSPTSNLEVEYAAGVNLVMLSFFMAYERRQGRWRKLLGDAGLEVKDIRVYSRFGNAAIIATKPQK